MFRLPGLILLLLLAAGAAEFRPPGGNLPPARRPGATSILPGGRYVAPIGRQYQTGLDPAHVAVNPDGNRVVTGGNSSFTVLERDNDNWRVRQQEIDIMIDFVFSDDRHLVVSAGETAELLEVDTRNGESKTLLSLNQQGYAGSFASELAYHRGRKLLAVVDPLNSRVAIVEAGSWKVRASVEAGRAPSAVAFSPDGMSLYVAEIGAIRAIDLKDPGSPQLAKLIAAGRTPTWITATADRLFVSNGGTDSITVIGAASLQIEREIPISIPNLEEFHGVLPFGSAYHPGEGWLLVAEVGINAVAVIDMKTYTVLGHIPAAWVPTHVAESRDDILVSSTKGHGTGPNASRRGSEREGLGAIQVFALPDRSELRRLTRQVMENNGFLPLEREPAAAPAEIDHVVWIVKGDRTYDEILGDIEQVSNGAVSGLPTLARFGTYGLLQQDRGRLQERTSLSLRNINITPNHHALARGFAFSDNFYANAALTPDTVWGHLEYNGITHQSFEYPGGSSLSDQIRADRFLAAIAEMEELPRLVYLSLPNDSGGDTAAGTTYPYEASYVADNDLALGRIVDALSHSKWWPRMAIVVTERAANGVDHIDSHRTIMMLISPWARRGYVSHVNANYPSLLKLLFRTLRIPPMTLLDAAASDLTECFAEKQDLTPYTVQPVHTQVFDPSKVH